MGGRHILLLLAIPAYLVGPASAQDGPGTGASNVLVEVTDRDNLHISRLNISVEDLRGMTVYGANNEQIGDVEEVLATPNGRVAAVTLDVGGFLGVRERIVVISLDQIELDGLRMVLNMTKEEVESLPEWGG